MSGRPLFMVMHVIRRCGGAGLQTPELCEWFSDTSKSKAAAVSARMSLTAY